MRLKVLGYARVSTEEQAEEGVSLAIQVDKIKAYCALYDLELIDTVVDAGVSAKSLDRPGVTSVLARLKKGEAQGLVCAKLDRLSRNVGDWQTLIDHYFGDRAGYSLFSVGDSIDTRTAAGRLVLNVLMSVAQWEREIISERVTEAHAHKIAKGETTGQIPFGKRLADATRDAAGKLINAALVADEAEQAVVRQIAELRERGLSFAKIADELNRRGVLSKEGGKWHKTSVIRASGRAA